MTLDSYTVRAIQLTALWAYGVSQPIFSVLESNPEFLVVRGSSRVEVLAFAVTLCLGVPIAALACEWLVSRISARAGDISHFVFIGAFLFPSAVRLVAVLIPAAPELIAASIAVCVIGVASYIRWRGVRLFLGYSIVLPVLGFVGFVHGVPLTTDRAEAADVTVRTPVPIVLVIFDEFPVTSLLRQDGEINGERYPHFGELARTTTWYPNASTVHESTPNAVPAILTGQMPRPGQLPLLSDHPENVFTLLANGYEFQVQEMVTHLCPTQFCVRQQTPLWRLMGGLFSDVGIVYLHGLLPDSVALGLPSIDQSWGNFRQQGQIQAAQNQQQVLDIFSRGLFVPEPEEYQRFLASMDGHQSAATLYAIHLFQPHAPWSFLPSGNQYGFGERIDGTRDHESVWERNAWLVTQGLQRHLLQVGYVDSLLGRLIDELKRKGLYDKALIVVTADHGASFVPGGNRRRVDAQNVADIAGVPLFVKYPGQRAGVKDPRIARSIDILPTIADVVGTRLPWHVDGRSLRRTAPDRRYVLVGRIDGTFVRAATSTVRRMRRSTVRSMAERFGEGRDSLYRIGRAKALLGRSIKPGRPGKRSAVTVRLDKPEWLTNVRKSSQYVPSRISGWVDKGQLGPGIELAVAVNGRIAALTQVFEDRGRQRFRALVPLSAFRDGFNRVDVFAVYDPRGKRSPVWLGSS